MKKMVYNVESKDKQPVKNAANATSITIASTIIMQAVTQLY